MGAVTAAVRTRLHATLRRQRPHTVVVFRAESDDPTTIKPTGERNRWERVVQAVPPDAERIELRDKEGGVLSAVDLAPPETREEASDRDTKLLKLLSQAQEMALDRQTSAIKGVTDAYERLAKLLAERLTSLERGYSEVLKTAFESTLMAAEAQAKLNGQTDEGGVEGMVKEVLQGLLPAGPAPQKRDNGVKSGDAAPQKGSAA